MKKNLIFTLLIIMLSLNLQACNEAEKLTNPSSNETIDEEADPAEVAIGERLFLETRFAQFYAVIANGDANFTLTTGDPALEKMLVLNTAVNSPFAGQTISCGTCHMVDQAYDDFGMRAYNDFSIRTPIPEREDGKTHTLRNTPTLVNANLERTVAFFGHFDAEFTSAEDLILATYSGRNYGWTPDEHEMALAHIVHIIKNDDGSGELAGDFGGYSYKQILNGEVSEEEFLLPEEFQIDVTTASDQQILTAIAKLVTAYMEGLVFAQDENGEFSTSPYDIFLQKNNLPRKPATGESDIEYSRRLLGLINDLTSPVFISEEDGSFTHHNQDFVFGELELRGLKIFLAEPANTSPSQTEITQGGVGSCVQCHAAPNFTDFKFHNTGATQVEYDLIHGEGEFVKISIPTLNQRQENPEKYLPASPQHPESLEQFASIPSVNKPGYTDLGLWNVFANSATHKPQQNLLDMMCESSLKEFYIPNKTCHQSNLLNITIGLFKTPGLRDLGHSEPYFHTGHAINLEESIQLYLDNSLLQRAGKLRNGSPELVNIALVDADIEAIVAFLKSLNEDYE